MNRRRFLSLRMGTVAAASIGVNAKPGEQNAWADESLIDDVSASDSLSNRKGSINRAYDYLSFAMDAYQQGQTPRLVQSFSDSQELGSTALVYDNALTRVRQAYWVGPFKLSFTKNESFFVRADGGVNLVGDPWFFQGSSVSDMSWLGIALARLFARTSMARYIEGSLRLGQWIVDNAFDTAGLGGYSFGVDANNNRLNLIKLTEHNVEVYGLFINLLAPLSGDASWTRNGEHAHEFLEQMWDAQGGVFYIGSNDGSTIGTSLVLEEVQSEAYLALLNRQYEGALDWTKTNLIATDTPQSLNGRLTGNLRLSGVSFSNVSRHATQKANSGDPLPEPDAVLFEGKAHMAAALLARRRRARRDLPTFQGDVQTASDYSAQIILAQTELGRSQQINGLMIPDESGVVAASSILNTGTGFSYYPNVHLAATSWYRIAASMGNPYQL